MPGRIEAVPGAELGLPAVRPAFSALGSERGIILPPLDDALARYRQEGAILPQTAPVLQSK